MPLYHSSLVLLHISEENSGQPLRCFCSVHSHMRTTTTVGVLELLFFLHSCHCNLLLSCHVLQGNCLPFFTWLVCWTTAVQSSAFHLFYLENQMLPLELWWIFPFQLHFIVRVGLQWLIFLDGTGYALCTDKLTQAWQSLHLLIKIRNGEMLPLGPIIGCSCSPCSRFGLRCSMASRSCIFDGWG